MKKQILAGILLCVMAFSGCAQAEPGMTRTELEASFQTAEGREAEIQATYEGAEVLSETVMEETGCIITEFSWKEAHNFVVFQPNENGYSWCADSSYYPALKIGREFVTVEEEMYDIFLRHTDEVASLEVMYTHEENAELTLNGKVDFTDSNVGWIRVTEVVPQWRVELVTAEIAGYDKDGQEISLENEVTIVEPSTADKAADAMEDITRRKLRRLIIKGLMG
ncbi:MAG: hypothetical protein IKZ01_02270 [Anaerotignum sp.]|nr:hypothetical protein [Anaerotignum sp.]